MLTETTTAARLRLLVPRSTGTHGDDLVAWGLAIVLADACGRDVLLRDRGDSLEVEAPFGRDLVDERIERGPPLAWRLHWLASTEKGRTAPSGVRSIDRDLLRESWRAVRTQPGVVWQASGDAPLMTTEVPAWWYPRFEPLTNPGTQWIGYNSLVEATEKLTTAPGLRLLVSMFDAVEPLGARERDRGLAEIGLKPAGLRWRNPPGFLYPTLNKGPTMRLRQVGTDGRIGDVGQPDWLMTDRLDRGIVELCLAYVGYFNVAQVLGDEDGRRIVVPIPVRVRVPRVLRSLDALRLRASALSEYLAADAALAYADASLEYLAELLIDDPEEVIEAGPVLSGATTTSYWQPSGNTYAPIRSGTVSLPAWLLRIRQQGFGAARTTVRLHRARLGAMRGRGQEERKLASERRDAISWYARALDGNAVDWFRAVIAWLPALRSDSQVRGGTPTIHPWTVEEVRRIAMAEAPDLKAIVGDDQENPFRRIATAIRHATVYAHFARQRKANVFDPQYDLVAGLAEAAERHPTEFLRDFYAFAARYNDETMRRNENASKLKQQRPMLRADDLAQLQEWVLDQRLGRIVPMALLAFGSSTLGRTGHGDGADGGAPEGDGGEDGDATAGEQIGPGEQQTSN